MQARIAHKAFLADFQRAGYPILADLEEYLPNGYQLRVIATTGAFLQKNRAAIVGYLKSTIQAYRFMKTSSNHAEMIGIINNSDLKFEEDMDQSMWEEEYPLIPGIPSDGSINTRGLQVLLDEEKSAGRVSKHMTIDKVLQLEPVKELRRRCRLV